MKDIADVTDNIRKFRNQRGFSQDYMAAKLNIRQPAYCNKESGKQDFNLKEVLLAAKEFDVPVAVLFHNLQAGNYFEQQTNTNHQTSSDQTAHNVASWVTHNHGVERELELMSEIAALRGQLLEYKDAEALRERAKMEAEIERLKVKLGAVEEGE